MSAQVRTTPRADAHILEIVAWWREHRPAAPFLFEDELDEAFELLAAQPDLRSVVEPVATGISG